MAIYLKIPGVQGSVSAQGFVGCIELDSFQSSVARKVSTKAGSASDREGTKPTVSGITITKYADATTPILFGKATTGTAEAQPVTISFVNTGAQLTTYLTATLTNAMISNHQLLVNLPTLAEDGKTVEQKKPYETFTLDFTKIEWKGTPFDATHRAGNPVSAGYNLETAQAA